MTDTGLVFLTCSPRRCRRAARRSTCRGESREAAYSLPLPEPGRLKGSWRRRRHVHRPVSSSYLTMESATGAVLFASSTKLLNSSS